MNFKHITIVATLTAISLIALTAPAKATAYRNTNIYLELKEGGINVNDGPTGPLGTATYKSGSWTGNVTPVTGGIVPLPNVVDAQGHIMQEARRIYIGRFSETNSSNVTCTGDVMILRHSEGQGMGANLARITRTTTGGNSFNCVAGSTTVQETSSPRPSPNSAGNFTTVEANTLKNNPLATWWRWQTAVQTQCRPNPSFASGIMLASRTQLNAKFGSGLGNSIVTNGGVPWLKVNNPTNSSSPACYVRAQNSVIQAVWLGF